jgi:hypothetical protein
MKTLRKNNNMVYSTSKYPAISVSYDMVWQQRRSGKRYASPSGHAFFVGGQSRKAIYLDVKSKVCNFCATWKKKFDETTPVGYHVCVRNHDGSSSSMEANTALTMIIDLFESKHVVVANICIDYDASTPAMLKWSNADYMKNHNVTEIPMIGTKDNWNQQRQNGFTKG